MRQPKRFQAPSLGEAYARVREELGGEAIILSTRKASAPGLFGQPGRQFVEVLAVLPEGVEMPPLRPNLDQDMAAHDLVRGLAEAAAMGMAIDPAVELAPPVEDPAAGRSGAEVAAASAPLTTPPAPAFEPIAHPLSMPDPERAGSLRALNEATLAAAANASPPLLPPLAPLPPEILATTSGPSITDRALVSALARQLTEVRGMLEGLVADRVTERVEGGPPAIKDVHELMVRQGLSQAVISPLLAQVTESLVHGSDRVSALRTVERKLAARLPQAAHLDLGRRPAAVFIVGPSGAGKTTLAVRLALEIARAYGLRVVVAGTDVNRAGAPQQLSAFGAAAGIDVRLCYAPGELKAILDHGETDLVIVDTPGHNGTRRDRMAELNAFAQAARRRSMLLALPATTKGSDLNDIVAAYSGAGIDGLVLTRCDETSTFGALASVAIEASIGVAYTTHSDQVSDAPRAGDNLALASAVVAGRWADTPSARPRAATPAPALARVG